jgi:hypothetical protein
VRTEPITETPEQRERLLSQLTPRDRRVVEAVMAQQPLLTAGEAIEALRNAGM